MASDALVGIKQASQILGVSEAALRYWTDEGKIKAFITPGGHRRYSKTELKKLMTAHKKILGLKELIVELGDTAVLHRDMVRTSLSMSPWYSNLTQESRKRLADLSREFLSVITRYLTEPSKRTEIVQMARESGQSFGETLADLGLPLTNSLEAFIMHRRTIIDASTQFMKKGETNGRVVEAIPMVDHLMDEALVALVSAHQARQSQGIDVGGSRKK